MAFRSVVLPAPLGPMTPKICPASTPKLTPSSASTPPNLMVRLRPSSSAIVPPHRSNEPCKGVDDAVGGNDADDDDQDPEDQLMRLQESAPDQGRDDLQHESAD